MHATRERGGAGGGQQPLTAASRAGLCGALERACRRRMPTRSRAAPTVRSSSAAASSSGAIAAAARCQAWRSASRSPASMAASVS